MREKQTLAKRSNIAMNSPAGAGPPQPKHGLERRRPRVMARVGTQEVLSDAGDREDQSILAVRS
jgi:hypothetical protein